MFWISNVWNNFAPFAGYMLKGYEPHASPKAPSGSAGPLTNRPQAAAFSQKDT